MDSAFHQLCPRYSGALTHTAPTAIRLWETFTFYLDNTFSSSWVLRMRLSRSIGLKNWMGLVCWDSNLRQRTLIPPRRALCFYFVSEPSLLIQSQMPSYVKEYRFDIQSNLPKGVAQGKDKKWLLKTGDPLVQVHLHCILVDCCCCVVVLRPR